MLEKMKEIIADQLGVSEDEVTLDCLLYTSPSPRDS